MAVTGTPQSAAEKKYLFAQQSAYGTAIADDASTAPNTEWLQLFCEHWEVDRDIKFEENPVAHGSRSPRLSSRIAHYKGAMPKFTIPGFAGDQRIDHFLYAAMQNVTEGAVTPYSKTYTFGSSQPDFSSDGGWFGTFVEHDPAASKSTKVADCICKTLTLSIKPGERLKYSAEFVGRGLASVTANPSGTMTLEDEDDGWWFEDIDVFTIGGTSYHLSEFELKVGYSDSEPIGQDGSGSFTNVGIGAPVAEAKIVVVKDADYHTLLSNFSGNTAFAWRLGWGNATPGTTDRDLDFAGYGKIKSTAKAHEAVMKGEINMDLLESDDGSTTQALTVILANAVDRTW